MLNQNSNREMIDELERGFECMFTEDLITLEQHVRSIIEQCSNIPEMEGRVEYLGVTLDVLTEVTMRRLNNIGP